MKINRWKMICAAVLLNICMIKICDVAYASEGYTTITVEAADDESGVYRYAIDSTEDSAWQESNTFEVLPGSVHTVYVKDAAGNITSSEVTAQEAPSIADSVYGTEETSYYDAEDIWEDPYEAGVGTGTGSGTVTDYTDDDSKEYYTITTKNGNNFYLIIDHRNSDSNVYFTKPVSELDLLTLAAEAGDVEETMLEQKVEEEPLPELVQADAEKENGSSLMEYLPMILIVVLLCGGYYYFMIYKKKKAIREEYDADAADMNQFIPVEDDDDAALFSYKGNKAVPEEEEIDDIIDSFYENNADQEEFTEDQEDYAYGVADSDNDDVAVYEQPEDIYGMAEDYDEDAELAQFGDELNEGDI